ncbi:MAG: CBS domain-containing protein [Myxococcota bacterium]|nr:CBS domain-containing protein [Myxococcota bacterium]
MESVDLHVRRYTVYTGGRGARAQTLEVEPSTPPAPAPARREAAPERVLLTDIMSRELVCARPELDIATVVGLMVRHHVGCIPVVDARRRPVGMITKFDLVEHLEAFMSSAADGAPLPTDLAARTADEVMMPIALSLDEQATVLQAAAMMQVEDVHHVLVVARSGALLGVISTKDITNWMVDTQRGERASPGS